ncbi:MAG: nucleotide sugar dehydrogenase [Desulfurococcales archaeon]|nr:nucleotide sugar dehydrogenase [Desulfurococcales archaeon]
MAGGGGNPVAEVYSGSAWVTVCGAGYVGLSLAAAYLRRGLRVVLVDIDRSKLEAIRAGSFSFVEDDVANAIRDGLSGGRLDLTPDCGGAVARSRVVVVTVPVYLDWDEKRVVYDAFRGALQSIGGSLKRGDLVIIESSVPPGTTEELARPTLEGASGLRAEEDFYLAYSPERIYVGRAVRDIEENYPKVVAGIGPKSARLAEEFYKPIARKGVIVLSRPRDAEFEKLAEGVYRDVNIALANELALAAARLGVDFHKAREAANTAKPHINIHLPGPGVGGACIPIYPYFLASRLLERGFVPEIILRARDRNERMPYEVVRLVEGLARQNGVDPATAKVALLGVAFRGEIDDTRLSPSIDVAALLRARGYQNLVAHDPYVKREPALERLGVSLTQDLGEALRGADIVLVLTRHRMYRGLALSEVLRLTGRESIVVDSIAYLDIDVDYPPSKLAVLGRPPGSR